MWALVLKFIGFLVPPEPNPWELVPGVPPKDAEEAVKAMRRWQRGMSAVAAASVVLFAGSFFTPYGFAVANDSKEQAVEATKPLVAAVTEIKAKLVANETANRQVMAALNELRAAAVADNIDRLIRRKCVETDAFELQALRRDINNGKSLYKELASREYDEPSCEELRRR